MIRVLLIEDSPAFLTLISSWLGELPDVYLETATTGAEAQQCIVRSTWDLVISDIELPEIDGLQLIRQAKAKSAATQVLVMTAQHRLDYALSAVSNADSMLLKPFTRDVFCAEIQRLKDRCISQRNSRRRVVLAVGAHPDDVEIGCGGTLCKSRAEGAEVVILTLSSGAAGGNTEQRIAEAQRAAIEIGATLRIGNLPDTMISEGPTTINLIHEVIKSFDVTHVYTHSHNDAHQDHRSVHSATLVASRNVANVFCYQSPSSTVDFRPSLYNEISDYLDQKQNSIARFLSQTSKCAYLKPDLIAATARYWGRYCGYGHAEAFEVIRQSN
jgi:LmbE family N-acetylglucosaminyl deacetylase/ActR/RegA family two-component response regulator